ncbi:MAG: molecular chaperone [Hafnia paralvei]|jgi:fimbrial chaperone protein
MVLLNNMKNKSLFLFGCGLIALSFNSSATVQLGANRLIYDAKKSDVSMVLKNSEDRAYLIQSWVDAKGNSQLENSKLPFVISPPLFKIQPKSENVVQVIYPGSGLPADRESLVWLNIKVIPSMTLEEQRQKNKVVVAVNYRVKLFYRPDGLQGSSSDATSKLHWKKTGSDKLTAINDSAYYVTMNKIAFNGKSVPISVTTNNSLVAPHSTTDFDIKDTGKIEVKWSSVNDFSNSSDTYTATLP